MYKKLAALAACVCLLACVGCGGDTKKIDNAPSGAFLEMTDVAGRKIVLPKQPERILALSPSYLEPIDTIGGKLIGRPTAKRGSVPKSMQNLPEVGHTFNVNMESVVGLKPDLVLASKSQHAKFIPLLESNKINTIEFQINTYAEVKSFLNTLGKIYNKPEQAKALSDKMDAEVKQTLDKLPKEKKKVVVLFATANAVTVSGPKTVAGCIVDMLGFENVAAAALKGNSEKTPYSMEKLVEQNPEIIYITSMGKADKIQKRLQTDFESNPAWKGLDAVKNKRVYALPEDKFLLNPGIHYPEAVEYMAKLAYPESFKK